MIRRALAAVSACVLASAVLAPGTHAQEAPTAAEVAAEARFYELLNESRAAEGLAPLVRRDGLSRLAREWSSTMASAGELSHNPDLLDDVQSALSEQVRSVAENVGHGRDVDGLHDAFLASPGHRQAVLGDYDLVGIGVVSGGSRTWVTFDFAEVADEATPGGGGAPVEVLSGNQPPPPAPADPQPGAQNSPPNAPPPDTLPPIDPSLPPADQATASRQVEAPPTPAPEGGTPAPEEATAPPGGAAPVITPSPAVVPPVGTSAVQVSEPSPAFIPPPAKPLELPGMEDLLALGPDQLDDLTAGAGEDEDLVGTTAAQDPSGARNMPSPEGSGNEQAFQAAAEADDASSGSGVLQILTLAVLGLAAAVATSIAIKPRRRAARVRHTADGTPPAPPQALVRGPSFVAPSLVATDQVAEPSSNSREPMHAADDDRREVPMPTQRNVQNDFPYRPVAAPRNETRVVAFSGRSVTDVAGDLGVDGATFADWVRAQREPAAPAAPAPPVREGQLPEGDAQLQEENRRLRTRIAELEKDRATLKRAVALWAKESDE